MKKAVFALLPLFVFAMALSAFAQGHVDTDKANTETVKVTVSGGLDLDWIYRDRVLGAWRGTIGAYAYAPSLASAGEGVVEAHYKIRLDVDLSEKVKVVLAIDNKTVEGGANVDQLGLNPEGLGAFVREANITLNEVFTPEVSISAGTTQWAFDLRGDGKVAFWDPAHSGSIYGNATSQSVVARGIATSTIDNLQPTGVVVSYNREAIHLAALLLPAIIEAGSAHRDEAGYAVTGSYDLSSLGKGSKIGGIIALSDGGQVLGAGTGTAGSMYTAGAGADLHDLGMKGIEVFGEFYIQGGTIGRVGTSDIKAGGSAFQGGGKWMGESDLMPWVELKVTYYSGDNTNDTKVKNFLSYEHNDDLMIVESDFLGMDWDTNLMAIKVSGGVSFSAGAGKNNVHLMGTFGFCKAAKEVQFGAPNNTKDLGNELDVKLVWDWSKQVSVDAGIGYLFGSDILQNANGGSAVVGNDDKSMLFTVGLHAKF